MAKPLPDELTLSLTDDGAIRMQFRRIPAGRFRMGARGEFGEEEPVHTVEITTPFYLGVYPVTQQQFAVWNESHKSYFHDQPNSPVHPAEQITWHEANDFCGWLSGRCSSAIPSGYVAGLPSEAQWEYACRWRRDGSHMTGAAMDYHTGDGEAALADAGWYDGNSDRSTHPVGGKAGNESGLYDMHGNVWEWCWDDFVADAYKTRVDGVQDPIAPARGVTQREKDADRVLRGGSWGISARYCRAAYRLRRWPGFRIWYQGFRVCLFPGPVPAAAGTGAESETASGDGARRQAAAKSQDAVGDVAEVDLNNESLPTRSGGTKFEI